MTLLIYLSPFAVIALVALLLGVRNGWPYWRSKNWPTVSGLLVDRYQEVETVKHRGGEPWKRACWYSYEVDGVCYAGSFRSKKDDDVEEDAYRIGNHLTVRYNPRDPAKSVALWWTCGSSEEAVGKS